MRINKYLAEAGICSRRRADELIASGVVLVNGQVADMGAQVAEGDAVTVDGKPVCAREAPPCHVLLHKPVGVVSTASDPDGRPTVLDILPERFRLADGRPRRLYPAGRLDFFSEGLLLITDDGPLTNALTHPRRHIPRVYEVTVRESVAEATLRIMRQGMTLAEGERLAPVDARVLTGAPGRTVLELVLRQGVNRQIRRMCRDLQLTVLSLRRVAMGPLRLGELPSGEARLLSPAEVAALRAAVGLAPGTPQTETSRQAGDAPQTRRDAPKYDSRNRRQDARKPVQSTTSNPKAARSSRGMAPSRSTRKA